jgi:hypothetical protein
MRSLVLACALALGATSCGDNLQPAPGAHRGNATVAGAVTARSANYKLIGTVSSNPGTSSSSRFTKRGGVVGATQAP